MNRTKAREGAAFSWTLEAEKNQNFSHAVEYVLGNSELPISQSREQIINTIKSSQVTIITAETGAGKSTQVPQFIAEQGLKAIVTQPRIVAARTVAGRVSGEVSQKMGNGFDDFVGYATADDRNDSPDNRILYVTDGLQLVRELADQDAGQERVLVLDEIHEWNENMEVLVAWAKKRMDEDPNFKTVIMSATMDAEPLAKYFANDERDVPIINVPGRTFEVTKSNRPDLDVSDAAIELAGQGENTLVFVPGKDEIDFVTERIKKAGLKDVVVLPLHGQMSAEDQQKAFQQYSETKIVIATNVAQTSLTIDDIDVVVDSGLERRKEVKSGVEGLYLRPISRVDCLQRAGRAGRTKKGKYILTSLRLRNGDWQKFKGLEERAQYGVPEILRTRLDGTVLRLAKIGLDATDLDFYHQPKKEEIERAKTRLTKLGALTERGQVTKIGRDMERMPIESRYARMMIEARKYDKQLQHQMAAIVSIREAGGILQYKKANKDDFSEGWRSLFDSKNYDSELIKMLEIFVHAQRMSKEERRENNILERGFSQANSIMCKLKHKIKGLNHQDQLLISTKKQRAQLVRCIVAGMVDNVYIEDKYDVRQSFYASNNNEKDIRQLSNRSIIGKTGKIIVGTPFDLETGGRFFELIEGITNADPVILKEVAPHLVKNKHHNFSINENGEIVQWCKRYFDGAYLEDFKIDPAPLTEERRIWLIQAATSYFWEHQAGPIVKKLERLQDKVGRSLNIPAKEEIKQVAQSVIAIDCTSIHDAVGLFREVKIEDSISLEEIEKIEDACPDEYKGLTLEYQEGKAVANLRDLGSSVEELANLSEEFFTLPNGKSIHVVAYGEQFTLEEYRVECRKRLVPWDNEASVEQKIKVLRQWLPEDKKSAYDKAKASGLPENIEWNNDGNAAKKHMEIVWVIRSDGLCRLPDYYINKKGNRGSASYLFNGTNSNGLLVWDQILPGEVVTKWSRDDYSSQYKCDVVYAPDEGITKEQLEKLRLIEKDLEKIQTLNK